MKFATSLVSGAYLLALLAAIGSTALMLPAKAADTDTIRIVAFGDSLTAGYLLPPSAAFPAQLQVALQAKGYKVEVMNAGVSGDTTGGGLERLDWVFEDGADGVILELGANDALRGTEPAVVRENLDKILTVLQSKGSEVLIAGMRAPTNWGADYKANFDKIFPDLAAKHSAALYPYFLEGVSIDPAYIMPDGLHPTAKGVAEIVKRILPETEALMQKIVTRKAAKN